MAYERLTNKPNNTFMCRAWKDGACQRSDSICFERDECRTYHRLVELEDKIESGLLVERPCKVGDKFYEVIPGLPPREWIVDEFVEGKESIVVFGRLNTEKGGYWKFWIDDFGKKIFTTKDAAEAKLKELNGKS